MVVKMYREKSALVKENIPNKMKDFLVIDNAIFKTLYWKPIGPDLYNLQKFGHEWNSNVCPVSRCKIIVSDCYLLGVSSIGKMPMSGNDNLSQYIVSSWLLWYLHQYHRGHHKHHNFHCDQYHRGSHNHHHYLISRLIVSHLSKCCGWQKYNGDKKHTRSLKRAVIIVIDKDCQWCCN